MTHLLDLSNELIDLIVANLERQDAFALRSCCRLLREATWSHCAKTWLVRLKIDVSDSGVRLYRLLVKQPRICQSIKHLWLVLNPADHTSKHSGFYDTLREYFSSLPSLETLTIERAQSNVHWKRRSKDWYAQHEEASDQVVHIFLHLLVTPNRLRTIEIKSSDFRGWSDGLLKLDSLAVMARASPLLQQNFASLVSLSISLNTSMDSDPGCYDALPTFVKAIPTLEDLTIAGSKRPRAPGPPVIFRTLAEATAGADQKLPRLKRLRLKFFPVEKDPLVRFIASHIRTLAKFQLDHVVLLESWTPLDPTPRRIQVVSSWVDFMKEMEKVAFVQVRAAELLDGRPERAQRVRLNLWERTPVRIEKYSRAIEEGRETFVF
ncbi:hypothetical protein IWX90DRAFT_489832 [Phyllosticta citrichinensis]|uniref:F-box domain-containing protein n=1 Tax=Phyllosticta citrichinensis TaxID=1130410 RepID=A0ABR1XIR0_9PEZI